MAKFLNKKEQVFDLKLTSYGNYLLSQGNFKPVYYAFYDDNVVYDIQHAAGKDGTGTLVTPPKELQNDIQRRIKDETAYIESFVLFEEVERQAPLQAHAEETHGVTEYTVDMYGTTYAPTGQTSEQAAQTIELASGTGYATTQGYSGIFAADYNPTQEEPRKDFFKFNAMIGDAYLDGDTQAAPAWKIVTFQGQISSSATEDLKNRVRIPQIDIDLKYVKEVHDYNFIDTADPDSIQQLASTTQAFKDNKIIALRLNDAVVYADEVNTELLTENFEIEVFEVGEYTGVQATGSIEFNSLPSNGDTITINDGISAQTFTFETTTSGDDTDVEIQSTTIDQADAFVNVFSGNPQTNPPLAGVFASTMTAEIVRNPNDGDQPTRVILTNNKFGPYYNIGISTDNATAFTIQGMDGGVDGNNVMKRKFFEKRIPQVQDGLMVSERPPETSVTSLTTSSVEYYFDVLTDYEVDQRVACKGSEIYNKESYYIDLDFECEDEASDLVYNDIYGRVTEPEVCLDQYTLETQ